MIGGLARMRVVLGGAVAGCQGKCIDFNVYGFDIVDVDFRMQLEGRLHRRHAGIHHRYGFEERFLYHVRAFFAAEGRERKLAGHLFPQAVLSFDDFLGARHAFRGKQCRE